MSFNQNSFSEYATDKAGLKRKRLKMEALCRMVLKEKPNILLLQETNFAPNESLSSLHGFFPHYDIYYNNAGVKNIANPDGKCKIAGTVTMVLRSFASSYKVINTIIKGLEGYVQLVSFHPKQAQGEALDPLPVFRIFNFYLFSGIDKSNRITEQIDILYKLACSLPRCDYSFGGGDVNHITDSSQASTSVRSRFLPPEGLKSWESFLSVMGMRPATSSCHTFFRIKETADHSTSAELDRFYIPDSLVFSQLFSEETHLVKDASNVLFYTAAHRNLNSLHPELPKFGQDPSHLTMVSDHIPICLRLEPLLGKKAFLSGIPKFMASHPDFLAYFKARWAIESIKAKSDFKRLNLFKTIVRDGSKKVLMLNDSLCKAASLVSAAISLLFAIHQPHQDSSKIASLLESYPVFAPHISLSLSSGIYSDISFHNYVDCLIAQNDFDSANPSGVTDPTDDNPPRAKDLKTIDPFLPPLASSLSNSFGASGSRSALQKSDARAYFCNLIDSLPATCLVFYTDGSCDTGSNSSGGGACGPTGAGVYVKPPGGASLTRSIALGIGTNSVGELVAIGEALDMAKNFLLEGGVLPTDIIILSDSKYAQGVLQLGMKATTHETLISNIRKKLALVNAVVRVY